MLQVKWQVLTDPSVLFESSVIIAIFVIAIGPRESNQWFNRTCINLFHNSWPSLCNIK